MSRIIDILSKIAEDVTPVNNCRIAAAIVIKNRIISIGINQKKTDPLQAKYSVSEHKIWLHAEINAIKKALNRISISDFAKCTLYVVRRKRDLSGRMIDGMSKPCPTCQRAIKDFKIKNVIWTEDGIS